MVGDEGDKNMVEEPGASSEEEDPLDANKLGFGSQVQRLLT